MDYNVPPFQEMSPIDIVPLDQHAFADVESALDGYVTSHGLTTISDDSRPQYASASSLRPLVRGPIPQPGRQAPHVGRQVHQNGKHMSVSFIHTQTYQYITNVHKK